MYADDAGFASKLTEGLADIISSVIVTVSEAAHLTHGIAKTGGRLCGWLLATDQAPWAPALVIGAAGQRHKTNGTVFTPERRFRRQKTVLAILYYFSLTSIDGSD